jgi:hypothetical protein
MGTTTITGPITSIVYDDVPPANWTLVPLSDGQQGIDSPTTISPTGTLVTVVSATNTVFSGPGTSSGFAMSSTFNVGDVVEVYLSPDTRTSGFGTVKLFDENGNNIVSGAYGVICRKLATGSGFNWGVTVIS